MPVPFVCKAFYGGGFKVLDLFENRSQCLEIPYAWIAAFPT